ncbi:pyridoxamine 5'-phosphate oxidase [Microstroma glucosiphilum]|uniref:pyridoxal 5'-phosphate synthase n=1 Tax=Pseudomicrostroma glucosiphilum TaxID=1684307 RepID=A0A316UED6_9BASI|nr:pyridoxamine 5'-phosphate oxidase [Pseudomicrostroma glucosiphilum]PWN23562.1 pyridoxamine 5'-phosphate oxidase [Pseudomicrostroma glucosiphilum]
MSDFVPPPTGTQITSHNQYDTAGLSSSDLLPSPLALFQRWFESAQGQNVHEPEAMLLSTVASSPTDGTPRPSSRVVLLKEIHPKEGLTFYTNYTSRKGRELQQNPHAAATFYWRETSQSVRFCGRVRRVEKVESQKYFDSRPVGSRVGAHASPQSTRVGSREELEEMVRAKEHELGVPGAAGLEGKEAGKKWEDKKLEVPEYWGGYRIEPYEVEFWCGRPNRLHDRFRYTRDENSKKLAGEDEWVVERLAP